MSDTSITVIYHGMSLTVLYINSSRAHQTRLSGQNSRPIWLKSPSKARLKSPRFILQVVHFLQIIFILW